MLGGASKVYASTQFALLNPLVLSNGYRIAISFGLDYDLQALVTDQIPEALQVRIQEALIEQQIDKNDFNVSVEFGEAGASSLNLSVLVDLPGDLAGRYQQMQRFISGTCLKVCTEQGWTLPFEQMTVHLKKKKE